MFYLRIFDSLLVFNSFYLDMARFDIGYSIYLAWYVRFVRFRNILYHTVVPFIILSSDLRIVKVNRNPQTHPSVAATTRQPTRTPITVIEKPD